MTVMRVLGLILGLMMLVSQGYAVYAGEFYWVQGLMTLSVGTLFLIYGATGRDVLKRLSIHSLGTK